MFWNKPKVTFHCKLPEVMERYPILPARSVSFDWWRQSALNFKHQAEQLGHRQHVTGTVKCSGLHNIMQRGWILTSWFDLTINTGTDHDRFEFSIPQTFDEYLKNTKWSQKLINWFSANESAMRVPLPRNSLQTLIKIATPWTVSVPRGKALLVLPVPYPDQPEFTATHGILEAGEFYDISPIIQIHTRPGELFIPAGTPLCQMMVIDHVDQDIAQQVQSSQNWLNELRSRFRTTHKFITRNHNDN